VIFSHAEQSYVATDQSVKKSRSEYVEPMGFNIQKMSMAPPSFSQDSYMAKEAPAKHEMDQKPEPSVKQASENVSVTVTELKNGEKPIRREMNWPSKENALLGLNKLFIVIESFAPNNARLDLVEISMTVNGATETLTLEEIDPAGLKAMLQALLTA